MGQIFKLINPLIETANASIFSKIKPFLKQDALTFSAKTYLGWGRKKSGEWAVTNANKNNSEFALLEDGFIRSIFPASPVIYSLSVDHSGVYYDATRTSDLESLISTTNEGDWDERLKSEVKLTKRNVFELYSVSKYNISEKEFKIKTDADENILVIDQVSGDMSLQYGETDGFSTLDMILLAKKENPEKNVFLKIHPDVLAGNKSGGLLPSEVPIWCNIIYEDVNSIDLLNNFYKVYVRTSQLGFEALMMDKEVICFGMPFYAGWGLTDDRVQLTGASRRQDIVKTKDELFYAAYMQFPIYIDPRSMVGSNLSDASKTIFELRKSVSRVGQKAFVFGFSFRKFLHLKRFLGKDVSLIFIPKSSDMIEVNTAKLFGFAAGVSNVVVWGKYDKNKQNLNKYFIGNKITRVEDGFIRSNGLGAKLVPPLSLAFDDVGIYYDANRPSKLENILNFKSFSDDECDISRSLIADIIQNGISKYGKIENSVNDFSFLDDIKKKKILIPGQVPTDASLKYGCLGSVKYNLDLVLQVRKDNPNAILIYKEHPDLVSGARAKDGTELAIKNIVDAYVTSGSIDVLIDKVDEISTLTSLTGFEGLLRGKSVTCYGAPFYSGWGLTRDKIKIERRNRMLTLEQLVYGTLVSYPVYVAPDHKVMSASETIEFLIEEVKNG